MAGIYIHIPFCKQACHYCDFHFSTSLKNKDALIDSILVEIDNRAEKWQKHTFDTIYFGGGTPSIVDVQDIESILNKIDQKFTISTKPEITLEGNPDDFTFEKTKGFKQIGINRLSIGIQSFYEEDLQKLHRSHTARQAEFAIKTAQDMGIDNLTIDLIYGIPGLSNEKWLKNIEKAIRFDVPHISAYALTVEKNTVLDYQIKKSIFPPLYENQSAEQFNLLRDRLLSNDFLHYEVSNFGKKDFLSKHNTNYWKNIPYLGLGPAAHSFDGQKRRWNISNNAKYIKQINETYFEEELLSKTDLFNEMIMTGLRTMWGVDLDKIAQIDKKYTDILQKNARKYIENKALIVANNQLKASSKTLFLIDGIISDLFIVE
jgi:oxygen-independent coproporphyrinogen-3 oxidase